MNFHRAVASLREASNNGSADCADRTFPAESMVKSKRISEPEMSASDWPAGAWRSIRIGTGGMIGCVSFRGPMRLVNLRSGCSRPTGF